MNLLNTQLHSIPNHVIDRPKVATLKVQKVRYCLYARKSTESEERQILSIDSQIKEMLQLAERENLEVVEIKRESHSAKATGQREIFNELVQDIRQEKFNGILTWAPDRISRNAGDLGAIVDLMDQKLLKEIRTFSQSFTDNPNEKFLLMILGSQAKLENDNRGINVKRGMRARVEMGLWPGPAPIGYLNQKNIDKKCQIIPDPDRASIVKQIFEKVACDSWSGRKIYHWLRFELNFKNRGNKNLALSTIFRILNNPFYYGVHEYPKKSGNWYTGKHKPIISKELYEKVQANILRIQRSWGDKQFAFAKLMVCGLCGSGMIGEEKMKALSNGTEAHYIYYGCSRTRDRQCKNTYIREDELIKQLVGLIDYVDIDKLGIKKKLELEVARFNKFQGLIQSQTPQSLTAPKLDAKAYAKYLLQEGSMEEKRDLLLFFKSKLRVLNKQVTLVE